MDARIITFFLFLCLSTGYRLKNDDVDDDILDMLQETDNLKEAPEMREDHLADRSFPVTTVSSSRSFAVATDTFTMVGTVSSSGSFAVATDTFTMVGTVSSSGSHKVIIDSFTPMDTVDIHTLSSSPLETFTLVATSTSPLASSSASIAVL